MAAFCINTHSQLFKDTAKRLGISEFELEQIAYKYGNQEGTFGQFPSDNYIISQIAGRPEMNAAPSTIEIWHEKYQQAQVFDSKEALDEAMEEAKRFFEDSSIGIAALPDGKFQMTVAEPNSTEEPLISYVSNNGEQIIDGKLGVNKEQLISLLGSTMYKANIQSVAVKELLQNAFDAVKIAQSQGRTNEKGKIKITLDDTKRTVTVNDNGIGMSPEIVQKAFFTIGGSYKGDNVDNRLKSGGLGLAKMAFLFSSNFVEVSTVKDGVKTYVKTNPEQIQGDNFKITTSKTDEPNGTTVTVGIPEYYTDENGERKNIWFLTRPSFLNEPMIGNVDVEVTEVLSWDTRTKTYDKNQIPEGYISIGKATSDFGDIEIYVAPQTSNTKYIYGKTLISGLHQFDNMFEANGASKGRFKFIINILPTVGVKSAVYPINNQREGFRPTVEPEVSDITYLMTQINRALEKKSVTEAFGSAMSMDIGEVAEVQRESSKENILNETVEEIRKKYAQQQKKVLGIPVGKAPDNSISLGDIRVERIKAEDEKNRKSSLDTSGVRFEDSEVSSIDTSKLDVTKPLFHNNTDMVIEEDGQRVLNEIGKLLMELKSLYSQTYKESGILSYNGEPVVDYISKQFWGISFDKGYGGVNVNPSIINMLAINPFYQVREYKGVDTALALTEYITHLVIHEFNHNYARSEDAKFTGRFPATYAEFAGIGRQFNKEWKNKLYILIRDNLETFVKYNKRYEQATNLGESFEGNKVTTGEESQSSRTENDGKDLFWNRSGENVFEDGEGSTEISKTPQQGAGYVNHSGGALQSDSYWGDVGERYGVKSNHYYHGNKTPRGNTIQSEADFQEGLVKVKRAAQDMGRIWSDKYANLLARNWNQVKYADEIFAVSSIVRAGERNRKGYLVRALQVDGGTGYAVQMAINEGKPVHVFDQRTNQWYEYSYAQKDFVPTDTPVLSRNFAGIGTSTSLTDAGKRAIEAVYEKTFNQQQAPQQSLSQQIATQGTTQQYGVVIDRQLKSNYIQWQQQNPNGIVAYRVNFNRYNTPEEAAAGRIGNPFSEGQGQTNKGVDTVQKFFEWLTTGNNFGEAKATEDYRQAIIQKIFATPAGTPILYYTELGRPSHATILGYLINHKELIGGQQVQQTQTETTEQEPLWAPPSVEREFYSKSNKLVGQIDNLFSGDIDASVISEEANKAVDWISDQLTQYAENPELVYNKFFKDNPSNTMSKEEIAARVSKMSRKELAEFVGLDNMVSFYREEVLSMTDENADLFENMDDAELDKWDAIKENLEGLIQLGYARFISREGFGFNLSDVEGETFTTVEQDTENTINPDDFNSQTDPTANEDTVNQQEHWQIESATRDIMDNASQAVKQAIADCFILEDNGKIDSEGNPQYDIAKDNLNRNERVVPIKAVRSIVKWIQGSTKLSQMTAKLEAKQKENPWISQIVTRLKDTTGNESDFQSQFFNTFCKHFQPYSIVKRRADGTYYTMVVNAHPALRDAMNSISIQYRVGSFALANADGVVMSNVENLAAVRDTLEGLGSLSEENRQEVVSLIGNVLEAIGMPQPEDAINRILTNTIKDIVWANTKNIVEKLTAAKDQTGYNPFEYGGQNSIRGFIQNIIRPFTNELEDTLVSSVYDSGKMYQSYITPSWTTKLFTKMHLPDKEFKEFLLDEFGQSEWFVDRDAMSDLAKLQGQDRLNYVQDNPNMWRLPWFSELVKMSEAERQKAFSHKVQLNFDKQNYMRGMNDLEYVMSVFTEYFAENSNNDKGVVFGNYRFPMISNKPSNEFIRFVRHIGEQGRRDILDGLYKVFQQELSRIQTVEMRNLKEGDAGYIANFDVGKKGKGKGLQFNFLDYLNDYLNGNQKDTALGQLIDRSLHADSKNQLSSQELRSLESLVKGEIRKHLDSLSDRLIQQYRENGIFDALKRIEHIGKSDAAVEEAIREFAWNDNYAEANILEILITDKAFYKNEEDVQKRLAQVHSPGIRGNWEARDFDGKQISDGKVRVLKLADYAGVVSDAISNVEAVFDRKIENADFSEREAWTALKESILEAYRDINVVDGQAFVSPTAYRKKAIAFGEWTREDEEVYNKLLEGKYNMADLQKVFNPRKPFTYGKVNKSIDAGLGTPIKTLNYGVQYKNSEYLLILADALMRGENTGRPNLLGAIFDVMEESAKSNPTRGIDFVVFESGVKTGLQGAISINEFIEDPNGREKAFTKMWNSAFKEDGAYNEDFIDVLDAEDYTTQQSVPEHFMHGSLQWGSQIRAIMPSDLETTFNGEPVLYNVSYTDDKGVFHEKMTAEEIRNEWEKNTARMVQDGVNKLSEELGLGQDLSKADRNILISKILQREILSNQRYGVDLLLACSVDEEGNFRIPLGDPIQSKRIEQLLNSIIKNRINKQKVAGGTLVEVTNFGTSKKLEIRFKDKNGGLLASKRDYLAQGHTEKEFKKYVQENQAGIAYYECYAPAWSRDIFKKFSDYKGNVDVEALRMLSPDLLKMFGYRIPTEDKYSTAPYMIVGFLPQEAGDGFMQPWETTVIDGSDFDVDKKNLMRKATELSSGLMSKDEFYESKGITEDTEEAQKEYKKYRRHQTSAEAILEKIGEGGKHTLSSEEEAQIGADVQSWYDRNVAKAKENQERADENALDRYNESYEKEVAPLEARYNELDAKEDLTGEEEKEMQSIDKKIDRIVSRLDRKLEGKKAENERKYNERIEYLDKEKESRLSTNRANFLRDKKINDIRQILDEGIFRDSSTLPENQRALFLAVKEAYLDLNFKVVEPASGTKDAYNNFMFDMQWAIATHESTADKMLNPGNFDPQKRMGYMVAANRLGYNWSELEKMETGDIKDLVFTTKNLMDFDVQTQFYRQNSVAGQILGIFAVAKSAHAIFEGRRYGIQVDVPFSIDGMVFSGTMEYDQKYDRTGVTLIGKHLGSLVGASADAVKDPVLNFMNINKETINVLNTALRLGMDFDTISLMLSSNVVSRMLDEYRRESLSSKTSFDKVVKDAIRSLERKDYIGKNSTLQSQDLTRREMVWAITGKVREGRQQLADQIEYKILNAVKQLSDLSKKAQPLTDLSRLNSVTSAPGPLYIDTIASDRKLNQTVSMDGIVKLKDGYKDIDGVPVVVGEKEGEGSYVSGVQVNRNNLDQMILAGAIERFDDYENATRDMVFEEIPSLAAFYQSYEKAKEIFSDLGFTTATSAFEKVLAAVPEDLQFSLYTKDKLLSSLADFFQSFILVQSGVIKSSELKRYTKDFVEDYIKKDYKAQEEYKNNPFIQAISPILVSKEGESERYALKIDTTGMEQSEKDALSAGWIQLEKINPELSHQLFAYNFFRGGIGFNPKTFMGLVPIQVKERIQGYIDAYSQPLEGEIGPSVIDQWIRNNWGNTDLVHRINMNIGPEESVIGLYGRMRSMAYGSPYIRVVTDSGAEYLYRETGRDDKKIDYEKVQPLGNNGEYLEIYAVDDAVSPLDSPQRGTLEIQESDRLDQKVDNPAVDEQTVEEKARDLMDFYQTTYGEQQRSETSQESLEKAVEDNTKDLDITTDKSKFDDILDSFC